MASLPAEQQSDSIMKRLLRQSKPYAWLLVSGLIAAMCLSGIDALFAYLISPIINKGFVHKDKAFIMMLPVLVLVLFLARGCFEYVSTYQLSKSTKLLLADMRKAVFQKILHLPMRYFHQTSAGSTVSLLIYNVDQLSNATTTTVLIVVREMALLIGLLFVMFYLSWKLSLLLVIILPLVFVLFRISSKRMRKIGSVAQTFMGTVTQIAQEAIQNFQVLRIFSATDYEQKRFDTAIDNARHQDLKAVKTNSISSGIIQILFALVLATVLWASMLPQLHLSAGAFAAIIGALIQLLRPIRRLTSINSSLQIGMAGARSVFHFLDLSDEINEGDYVSDTCKGEIVFKDVSYQYDNAHKQALRSISFNAPSGSVTALVGYSGGGKTTLVNLLPRFMLPKSGQIVLDGVDLIRYDLKGLREHIGLVSQTPQLFNDTILNNIAYGEPDTETNRDKAIAAAKAAYIWDFIQEQPDGLDTVIGDHGVLLSGGQKQRLAIARAIYKDPPILILDEATSALDSHSEQMIQSALDHLMEGRTTFVIAHRLSTILHADQILVLHEGALIEQGTHHALLAQQGRYAELYALQFDNARLGQDNHD